MTPETAVTPPVRRPSDAPAPAAGASARQRLFRLHRSLGLHLGLILFVICFTGTIATLSPQIDWLLHPEMRVTPGAEPLPWQTLLDRARDAFPEETVGQATAPGGPRSSASVTFNLPATPEWPYATRTLHLDPYTGAVLGQTNPLLTVQHFLRLFHKQFFVYGTWVPHGILIVGAWSFVLLASVLSGFVSYRTWFRNLFTMRPGAPRRLLSDLHRLIGIWALAFSLIIALTGLWYFADRALETAGLAPLIVESIPVEVDASRAGDTPRMISLDAAIARAETALPGFAFASAFLPSAPGSPILVYGEPQGALQSASAVYLDPFTGAVLAVRAAAEADGIDQISQMVNPLHFGDFGGIWTRVLWFLLGLALTASILIGCRIWFLRTEGRREGEALGWQGVAALAATVAVIAAAAYHTYRGIDTRLPHEQGELIQHFQGAVGPWTAYVTRERAADRPDLSSVTVRLSGDDGAVANFASAELMAGDEPTRAIPIRPRFQGDRVQLPLGPEDTAGTLQLRVTSWGGEAHRLVIPAAAGGDVTGGPSWRGVESLALRPGVGAVSLAILFAILGVAGWWMWMMYARVMVRGSDRIG